MTTIRATLSRHYPSIEQMGYCAALRGGRFDRDAILRAEVVELYRALHIRSLVKQTYVSKIEAAVERGTLSPADAAAIHRVIDDEGETEDHIDHLEMRLKLFQSLGITRRVRLRADPRLDEINRNYVAILEGSDVFQVIGINAAIEGWYVPISAFFEAQYLRRGFSADEVETYAVHKAADDWHSGAGFDVLERNLDAFDTAAVEDAVRRTFATALAYDAMKVELAGRGDIRELVESFA